MAITPQALFADPALFLYELDDSFAIFQPMTRRDIARSIFLDGRIRHGNRKSFRVPIPQLGEAYRQVAPPRRPLGWIFHVAQCGSTLLARALDHPGRSLVLREPAALRRLGVAAGGEGDLPAQSRDLLPVVRDLLGKRWEEDRPAIIKATVPVNFIAHDLMAMEPDAPAVILHFPLANYVAAIMRTPGHVDWTERVFGELRLGQTALCQELPTDDPAQKAAALWFFQMKRFEALIDAFPNVRSLDAARLFDDPIPVIDAAARLFGVEMDSGEVEAIAASELFHSYSKNPALDYDPDVRIAREAEAMARLAPAIGTARKWVAAAANREGLPEALGKPLVGDPVSLLG